MSSCLVAPRGFQIKGRGMRTPPCWSIIWRHCYPGRSASFSKWRGKQVWTFVVIEWPMSQMLVSLFIAGRFGYERLPNVSVNRLLQNDFIYCGTQDSKGYIVRNAKCTNNQILIQTLYSQGQHYVWMAKNTFPLAKSHLCTPLYLYVLFYILLQIYISICKFLFNLISF